jgi:hypothetical protein
LIISVARDVGGVCQRATKITKGEFNRSKYQDMQYAPLHQQTNRQFPIFGIWIWLPLRSELSLSTSTKRSLPSKAKIQASQ